MAKIKAVKKAPVQTKPQTTNKISFSKPLLFLLVAGIAIVTFICFVPALKNGFTNWDDNAYVFENTHLGRSFGDAIVYFFGPHYFIGNYIPLTMLSYTAEFHFAGIDAELFHKTNILIHTLNVILVFWFIYLLSGKRPLVAAVVSLFFGIHPMHVESVAWIAELKDVLYTMFFLAGLISYLKYFGNAEEDKVQKKKTLFALSLLFFILSVLSKPSAVVFPAVLLLIDFYCRRKFDKWIWLEKLPFFIVSVVFGIIAINAQHADRLIHDYYPVSQRFFFATHSLLEYLWKLFLPINLSIFHPYPDMVDGHLPYFYYATPAIVLLLFYAVYKTLKFTRIVAFGFLFFFINLVLVLQLISVGDAIMAERYTYVSYIGLFFVIAMGIDKLYQNQGQKLKIFKPIAITATIALAGVCSFITYARCAVWENDNTIATDLLDKYPNDRLALNNKGFILYTMGRYDESITLFKRAIELKPDYVMAYINLIDDYLAQNDMVDAEKTADQVLKIAPKDFNVLNNKGFILFRKHNFPEAIKYYQASIQLKKENLNAYIYLSQSYFEMKDYENALKILDIGLSYYPQHFVLLNNKGYTLQVLHRYKEAIDYLTASLKNKPDYSIATNNLNACYKALDDSARAKK